MNLCLEIIFKILFSRLWMLHWAHLPILWSYRNVRKPNPHPVLVIYQQLPEDVGVDLQRTQTSTWATAPLRSRCEHLATLTTKTDIPLLKRCSTMPSWQPSRWTIIGFKMAAETFQPMAALRWCRQPRLPMRARGTRVSVIECFVVNVEVVWRMTIAASAGTARTRPSSEARTDWGRSACTDDVRYKFLNFPIIGSQLPSCCVFRPANMLFAS